MHDLRGQGDVYCTRSAIVYYQGGPYLKDYFSKKKTYWVLQCILMSGLKMYNLSLVKLCRVWRSTNVVKKDMIIKGCCTHLQFYHICALEIHDFVYLPYCSETALHKICR